MGVAQATRNCALVLNLSFRPAWANDETRPSELGAKPQTRRRLKRRTGIYGLKSDADHERPKGFECALIR